MHNYTTLGSGAATKLLSVAEYSPARTVTSAPFEAAVAAAHALQAASRRLTAALFGVAVEADGVPVEARRHLLGVFDEPSTARGGAWSPAEELVAAVSSAVADVPAPARRAVRDELDSQIVGFDGVLVPARIEARCPKIVTLDLVISGPLTWLGDELWSYVLGPHGDLGAVDLGDGPVVASVDLDYPLVMELYDVEPFDLSSFASMGVAEMVSASSDDDPPHLEIRPAALLAWVRHHRPGDVDQVAAALDLQT